MTKITQVSILLNGHHGFKMTIVLARLLLISDLRFLHQALDFAYVFSSARTMGSDYFINLEDDVRPSPAAGTGRKVGEI